MLLSVNDIHVYYGAIHAVKGVSLEVNEGEVVTLIGANGAGKSTVLNTISGLLRAKSGTIDFMGTPINTMAPNKIVQLGLAQCPEGRRVFAHMTVEENLEMGAYTRPNSSIEGNLEHVYELFPRLKERSKQISGTLSGGEQQMLAMGRAMMSHPKLLMLDEPSMGLAPVIVSELFEKIQQINRQGMTILLVEQNAKLAMNVSHYTYVLEQGTIPIYGPSAVVREDPRVIKTYLGRLAMSRSPKGGAAQS